MGIIDKKFNSVLLIKLGIFLIIIETIAAIIPKTKEIIITFFLYLLSLVV